jgi:toxin ParE1/3/4
VLKLKIKPFAEYDLAESMEWYELQQPGLGIDFFNEVDKAISFILKNPLAYAVCYKRKGVVIRFAVLNRFPYVIVYSIDQVKEHLVIEAVWHTSRSPKNWKSRL